MHILPPETDICPFLNQRAHMYNLLRADIIRQAFVCKFKKLLCTWACRIEHSLFTFSHNLFSPSDQNSVFSVFFFFFFFCLFFFFFFFLFFFFWQLPITRCETAVKKRNPWQKLLVLQKWSSNCQHAVKVCLTYLLLKNLYNILKCYFVTYRLLIQHNKG